MPSPVHPAGRAAARLGIALLLASCTGSAPGPVTPPRTRLLVVGFDGMSWDVVSPLLAAGRMPNLKRLIDTGTSAPLRTIFPPSSPPAWTSAVTGVNPGKHGIFGFLRPIGPHMKQERAEFADALDRRYVPLWTLLSRAQRKVGVINVPCSSPADEVNGFMVGGFPHRKDDPVEWPKGILGRFPGYELDVFADAPKPGDEEAWLAHLVRVEDERRKLALSMLGEGGYDLFFVVFTGTDRIQHFFWRFRDPTHPQHDAELARRYGPAIDDFHVRMDATLGELLAASGPGTTTLVLSDHGMGPLHHGIAVEPLLGLLHPGHRPGEQPRCYFYNYFGGQIYLALEGREPFGHVAPGAEYERVRDELAGILKDLRDPQSGTPLVKEIHKREEVYQGDAIGGAPDLLFLETDGYLVARLDSSSLIDVLPLNFFSGFHRMDGMLVLSGPGIRSGLRLEQASILDVTPTLLYLLDQPIGDYMDGRPLGDAIDPALRSRREPRLVRMDPAAYREKHVPLNQASPEVEEQLRSLGYIR